jgi:urease accessory protein
MVRKIRVLLLLLLASGAALAHPGHAQGGFAAGLIHPLLGADHLLAMLAVGFWAGRFSGGARWLLPVIFVACMGLGAFVSLPYVEPAIALSLLVLGLAVAIAMRVDPWIGALPVAVFALYHGQAHFSEVPAGASLAGFAAGVLIATASLHLTGMVAALQLARVSAWLPRAFGALTVLVGAWFLVA